MKVEIVSPAPLYVSRPPTRRTDEDLPVIVRSTLHGRERPPVLVGRMFFLPVVLARHVGLTSLDTRETVTGVYTAWGLGRPHWGKRDYYRRRSRKNPKQ